MREKEELLEGLNKAQANIAAARINMKANDRQADLDRLAAAGAIIDQAKEAIQRGENLQEVKGLLEAAILELQQAIG